MLYSGLQGFRHATTPPARALHNSLDAVHARLVRSGYKLARDVPLDAAVVVGRAVARFAWQTPYVQDTEWLECTLHTTA